MTNTKYKQKIYAIILIIISVLTMVFTPLTAFAEESSNKKTPLTELTKDENFNVEDYVENPTDYSLHVIQVAESTEGKLNIFTFQPARNTVDLKASSINISYGFSSNGENLSPKNYSLKLISTEGCFDKYEVEGFSVLGDEHRYYNIVSIYRRLSANVPTDTNVSGGTTTEKAYHVGQQWHAYTLNEKIRYEMNTFETVEITTNYTGFLQMNTDIVNNYFGSSATGQFQQMWFIAFDVEDYIVEHIYNADMSYTYQRYQDNYKNFELQSRTWKDENPVPDTVYLSDADKESIESNTKIPFLKEVYSFKRIMKSADFIKNFEEQGGEFSEEAKAKLNDSQWVFAFKETSFSNTDRVEGTAIYTYQSGTVIADATVLRIKFMDINHKIYDLGAVNDKTTADDIADGYADGILTLQDEMRKIVEIIMAVVGLIVLLLIVSLATPVFNVLGVVFKGIVNVVSWLLSFVIAIVTFPFRLITRKRR